MFAHCSAQNVPGNLILPIFLLNTVPYRSVLLPIPYICFVSWTECNAPIGMEDYSIINEQFNSSSVYSSTRPARAARLNFHNAWRPKTNWGSWIQVDLMTMYSITGVMTQGVAGGNFFKRWYTKTYQVQYQLTPESSLEYVKDGDNMDEVIHTSHNWSDYYLK